jgi:hypothetical protein
VKRTDPESPKTNQLSAQYVSSQASALLLELFRKKRFEDGTESAHLLRELIPGVVAQLRYAAQRGRTRRIQEHAKRVLAKNRISLDPQDGDMPIAAPKRRRRSGSKGPGETVPARILEAIKLLRST